jgi:hypothetical protein
MKDGSFLGDDGGDVDDSDSEFFVYMNSDLVQYILVHDKICIKMECEYWHSFMKNNRGTYIPSGKGCFYIWAGLKLHDVSVTITYRELCFGILKVA